MRETGGGRGLPHLPAFGGGVGVGVGPGEGVGVGEALGVGLGVGVSIVIFGIATVRIGDDVGVWVGSVGSSSLIAWHPTRTSAVARPQARVLMATPSP
jgi:hypothetical protein